MSERDRHFQEGALRILVSDYSGHPFQVQLSRALAARGHEVRHVHCASFQTPKGRLERAADDPPGLSLAAIRLPDPFRKASFVRRRRQEIDIGKAIGAEIAAFAPEVVISSNAPLDCQRQVLAAARAAGAGFVFWVQDIYSRAIAEFLARKLPLAGHAIGAWYRRLEARLLRESDHAVVIAEDFVAPVRSLAGPALPLTVIENWAPLDELPALPREAAAGEFRVVYAGTLGLKHDPALIAALAQALDGEVRVYSEGPGADWLRAEAAARGIGNLEVSGWLGFAEMPAVLASADALLVILDAGAGRYSVPSKTLTYLCAGRAILAAVPADNLAARLVENSGGGIVVAPGDSKGLAAAARRLAEDAKTRDAMGRSARAYAERVFEIAKICDQFESIARQLAAPHGKRL